MTTLNKIIYRTQVQNLQGLRITFFPDIGVYNKMAGCYSYCDSNISELLEQKTEVPAESIAGRFRKKKKY